MTNAEGRQPARGEERGRAAAGAGTIALLVVAALLAIGLPALLWQHWDGIAAPDARGGAQAGPGRAEKRGRGGRARERAASAMSLAYADDRGRELGRIAVADVADPYRGAGDAPKGERYVRLTMEIENTGDDALPVRPEGFVLRDASGFTYAPIPAEQASAPAAPDADAADATKERRPKDNDKGNDRKAAASPAAEAASTPERKTRREARAAATPDAAGRKNAAKQDDAKPADAKQAGAAADIAPLRATSLAPGGVARGDLLFAAPADAVLTNLLYVPDQNRLLIVATLGSTSEAGAKSGGGKAGAGKGTPDGQS